MLQKVSVEAGEGREKSVECSVQCAVWVECRVRGVWRVWRVWWQLLQLAPLWQCLGRACKWMCAIKLQVAREVGREGGWWSRTGNSVQFSIKMRIINAGGRAAWVVSLYCILCLALLCFALCHANVEGVRRGESEGGRSVLRCVLATPTQAR